MELLTNLLKIRWNNEAKGADLISQSYIQRPAKSESQTPHGWNDTTTKQKTEDQRQLYIESDKCQHVELAIHLEIHRSILV